MGKTRIVTASAECRYNPMRMLLNNIRWGLMDEKLKGEEALRASGVPFTIVRPGGLTDQPGGKAKLTWSASSALFAICHLSSTSLS